jgi:hypothetical protein
MKSISCREICLESDYSIFAWRFTDDPSPTLHVRNPSHPLPSSSSGEYTNPSFYAFRPQPSASKVGKVSSKRSVRSSKLKGSKRHANGNASVNGAHHGNDDGVPTHKKDFEKFHSENGNRTIIGQIGPVKGGPLFVAYGRWN